MLFADDIVLMMRLAAELTLSWRYEDKLWSRQVEQDQLERKFSDITHKAGEEMKLDTQVI